MSDRNIGPAKQVQCNIAREHGNNIPLDIIGALGVVGGFVAIALIMDLLLQQLPNLVF
ncbi:MAG: hypothetical protein AB7D33_07565 [Sphingobium sp.]